MVMNRIANWFKTNRNTIIRNSFLLPILLVVIMSISHVVSWYDLGNPLSWAIYLSVAIEIFALASVSAASIRASRGSIWFLFGLVTAIQIIGNVFYEYKEIDPNGTAFLAWVEMIQPAFTDWDAIDHRRLLALIQGGTLPIMSLTSLHFYLQFNDKIDATKEEVKEVEEPEMTNTEKWKAVVEEKRPDMPEGTVMDEMGRIDAEATLANILTNELEKIETELEEARDEVEPIDEEALLAEIDAEEESVSKQSFVESKTDFTDNIDEAYDFTVDEMEKRNKKDDEGPEFGPPHINNQGTIS